MHPQLIRNRRALLPQKSLLSQRFQKLSVCGWTLAIEELRYAGSHKELRCRSLSLSCRDRAMVAVVGGGSGGFGEDRPTKTPGLFDASGYNGVDPEAAAVMMQRKAKHKQNQKKIRQGPLAGRAV